MAGHAVVQAGAARHEGVRLADVFPGDQSQELAGDIAVKWWRAERVLGHRPARRETSELDVRRARHGGRRREHAIDRRVRVVEGHRVDALKAVQVVLEGHVVASPRDDVERRVIDLGFPQSAAVLGHHAEVALAILEGRDRRHEVTRVRQAEGADRSEVGQAEMLAVVLADVSPRGPVRQLDAKLDAARHQRHVSRRDIEHAQLGVQRQRARLRNDQQLAVGVVEKPVGHRPIGGVDVNGRPGLRGRVAIAAKGDDPVDEVGRLGRNRQRSPAQLIRGRWDFVERAAPDQPASDRSEWLMYGRWTDAIGPRGTADAARGRERGAIELFHIQTERRPLGCVLVARQGPSDRFRRKIVPESGLIRAFCGCHGACRLSPRLRQVKEAGPRPGRSARRLLYPVAGRGFP